MQEVYHGTQTPAVIRSEIVPRQMMKILLTAILGGVLLGPPLGGAAGAANCPKGNRYADGCRRAQAGTPQNPTLLNAYGAHRPPWNAAGVDYPVGESGAMQDVTT
ncbi:MAG: hypothetical protein WBW81_10020, partial [Methylocella sp.]